MKYEVIARRYRPRKFQEVVGQESISQTLLGGILQDRMAHAYLFCGPRGVGKTSMARIFAKALNCPRAADRSGDRERWAQPCDSCSTCEAVHSGRDIDVIEMDGASHRGIEDIRQLIEGVNRPATRGLYKIYIVDEVHMLTREAFNALLKTLEEPPSHVKFIFATTEPHKIPDTVLSRCQRFDFHPISQQDVVKRLRQICAAEGREASDDILEKIARYGKGGLRDAQTLLDQLMTFSEGELGAAELDRITGRVPETAVDAVARAIIERRPSAVLETVRDCFSRGADPAVLLEQIIESFHLLLAELVKKGAGEGAEATEGGDDLDRAIGSLQILLDTAIRLRTSAHPDIAVEVVLVKLSRLEDPRGFERALEQLVEIERRGGAAIRAPAGTRAPSPAPSAVPPASPSPPRGGGPSAAVEERSGGDEVVLPCDIERLRSLWEQVQIEMRRAHPDIASFLGGVRPEESGAGDLLVLQFENDFAWRHMKSERRQKACEQIIRDVTGQPWKVRMEHVPASSEEGSSEPAPAGSAPSGELRRGPDDPAPTKRPGPAAGKKAPGPERDGISPDSGGREKLRDHPLVKKAIELFDGRLM